MQISKPFVGLLALLCSSASMAATVTVSTPGTVALNTTFLVTISGSNFLAADPGPPIVANQTTIGATLGITYTGLTYVGPAGDCPPCTGAPAGSGLPASGPFSSGSGGSYTPNVNPVTQFDITTAVGADNGATGTDPAFTVLILAFSAPTPGTFSINLLDNGTTRAFFQYNDPFDVIPVTYIQGSVTAVPVPAAAWLIAPAILAAGRFSRRRKAA